MTKLLAIDTSTMSLSLAVVDGNKVIAEHNSASHKTMAETIVTKINQLLKKAKTPLERIDGFVVGLGPGSFTSLRVGVSTVKALALATGKPLIGISSHDVIASGLKEEGAIGIITDARRNMIFSAFYEKQDGKLFLHGNYQLSPLEDIASELKDGMVVTGDGLKVFKDEIQSLARKRKIKLRYAKEDFWEPKASVLGQLAQERFGQEKFEHPAKLVPLYLYSEDCQIARK